jgi:hypothetical protein
MSGKTMAFVVITSSLCSASCPSTYVNSHVNRHQTKLWIKPFVNFMDLCFSAADAIDVPVIILQMPLPVEAVY